MARSLPGSRPSSPRHQADNRLAPRDRPARPIKLDGRAEARLVALACSPPPEGRATWTMQLLADKLVELDVVESIS